MTVEDQAGGSDSVPAAGPSASSSTSVAPVTLVLAADATAPGAARRALAHLAAAAGADPAGVDAVRLVISEIVANVVTHAYDRPGGSLQVSASPGPGAIAIEVSDDGRGPAGPSPRPGLGAGWRIVTALSDRFTVRPRAEGGTFVHVSMPLVGRTPVAVEAADPREALNLTDGLGAGPG